MIRRFLRQLAETRLSMNLAGRTKRFADQVIRHNMHVGFDDTRINGEGWLAEVMAPRVSTFFDVGANRGDFSSQMLSLTSTAKGIAFEPAPGTFRTLFTRFGSEPRVRLVNKALSDSAGVFRFYEEPGNGLSSSLSARVANENSIATDVQVSTVDLQAVEHGIQQLDYLKIDAEGYDLAVIKGAKLLLQNQRINLVQFEYHTTWRPTGHTLLEAKNFLSDFGYETFLLRGPALFRLDYERVGEYFGYSNYVALPEHSLAWFKDIRPAL